MHCHWQKQIIHVSKNNEGDCQWRHAQTRATALIFPCNRPLASLEVQKVHQTWVVRSMSQQVKNSTGEKQCVCVSHPQVSQSQTKHEKAVTDNQHMQTCILADTHMRSVDSCRFVQSTAALIGVPSPCPASLRQESLTSETSAEIWRQLTWVNDNNSKNQTTNHRKPPQHLKRW